MVPGTNSLRAVLGHLTLAEIRILAAVSADPYAKHDGSSGDGYSRNRCYKSHQRASIFDEIWVSGPSGYLQRCLNAPLNLAQGLALDLTLWDLSYLQTCSAH